MLLMRDDDDPADVVAWLWDGEGYQPITITWLALLLSQ